MRINKFLSNNTGLSRRRADEAIRSGRVQIDERTAVLGDAVEKNQAVRLDGQIVEVKNEPLKTIMLNKPTGYVCSRNGQGSKTIYDLLPDKLNHLNPVGRLDKDSSGLLLMTNDGQLAERLTHPKYQKTKLYEVTLDENLQPLHQQMISDHGIQLDDGNSRFLITKVEKPSEPNASAVYQLTLTEGRNRQIRRTFAALGYKVTSLHRTHFGPYSLGSLQPGEWQETNSKN